LMLLWPFLLNKAAGGKGCFLPKHMVANFDCPSRFLTQNSCVFMYFRMQH
jgi:hypothetical protein